MERKPRAGKERRVREREDRERAEIRRREGELGGRRDRQGEGRRPTRQRRRSRASESIACSGPSKRRSSEMPRAWKIAARTRHARATRRVAFHARLLARARAMHPVLSRARTMRIAITGATGNLGTSCLLAMVADERIERIVAIARRGTSLSLPRVTFVSGDVSKDDSDALVRGGRCGRASRVGDQECTRSAKRSWKNNVEGSARVFSAAARAGVRAIVHASSVGVYSPGPPGTLVEESWPRDGVSTSRYSLEKAAVERELDSVQARFPRLRIVRMRPALVFKREAASEIQRLFLGPYFPRWLLKPGRVPPIPEKLTLQCVHSLDVGEAFRRAVVRDVRGAFNLATDPVLDSRALASALGTRTANISPESAPLARRHGLSPPPRSERARLDRSRVRLAAPLLAPRTRGIALAAAFRQRRDAARALEGDP